MSVYHNQHHQPDKQIILVELLQIGHQIKIWCLVASTLSLSLSFECFGAFTASHLHTSGNAVARNTFIPKQMFHFGGVRFWLSKPGNQSPMGHATFGRCSCLRQNKHRARPKSNASPAFWIYNHIQISSHKSQAKTENNPPAICNVRVRTLIVWAIRSGSFHVGPP